MIRDELYLYKAVAFEQLIDLYRSHWLAWHSGASFSTIHMWTYTAAIVDIPAAGCGRAAGGLRHEGISGRYGDLFVRPGNWLVFKASRSQYPKRS